MFFFDSARAAAASLEADLKREFRSASGRAVFNIAGNKYRVVVWINDPYRVVYIRFVGMHRDYDAIDAQTV